MFTNRRLAKRSIIGTRVCALWQDGRYYPGFIEAQSSDEGLFTCAMFIVKFDDGYQKDIPAKYIIGPGFQAGPATQLKHGQKVYLTLHGREVSGLIITQDDDSVLINVRLQTGQEDQLIRKVDDVRLLESRKSARLVDQETDYSKLNDVSLTEATGKKRTVSHVIDVPTKAQRHRIHHSPSDADVTGDDDTEMVDENSEQIAAIALTNLSCSPASPTFPSAFKDKDFRSAHVTPACPEGCTLSSSTTSSGFGSGNSERNEYSPPLPYLSESAPATVGRELPFSPDEGVDLEEGITEFYNEAEEGLKRTVYQCTWRKCGHTDRLYTDVARHVRKTHLQRDSDSELSDEEEFYIDDVVVGSVDTMTKQFAEMHTSSSSPPVRIDVTPASKSFDHDYLKKDHKSVPMVSSVPTGTTIPQTGSTSSPIPIAIPEGQIKRSLSWQVHSLSPANMISQPIRMNRPTAQDRLHQHQAQSPKTHLLAASPKGNIIHRKPRSEVRKCRKVYGMEKRDMWCTQCKWKKACTRFLD